MRLYRIKIAGATLDWAGTQTDAKASAKKLQADHGDREVEWDEEDVPTSKPELLEWLKANATNAAAPGE